MRNLHTWPLLTHILAGIGSCTCHSVLKCPKMFFRWEWTSDICIFGHTPKEFDQHPLGLIQTAKDHSIVFNCAKCHIRQPQIAFYGAEFTAQGMWPDPSKIQALQDFPTPNPQAKLQSFLGLINYLQSFIPGLSAKTTFLCGQLANWDWIPWYLTNKQFLVKPVTAFIA